MIKCLHASLFGAQEIDRIIAELKSHRSEFRQVLRHPSLDYCCVSGNEVSEKFRKKDLCLVSRKRSVVE